MSLHDEPSHDDLAELDLTAAQADDLTALLRGAAARVEVPAPAAPVRYSSRRPPTAAHSYGRSATSPVTSFGSASIGMTTSRSRIGIGAT